jgi:hypothetical protein
MLLIDTIEGDGLEGRARESQPFGPGFGVFPPGAVKMEVWGTEFNSPDADYCEFRLLAVDGRVLMTRRVEGY